jgi:hypothetical protein
LRGPFLRIREEICSTGKMQNIDTAVLPVGDTKSFFFCVQGEVDVARPVFSDTSVKGIISAGLFFLHAISKISLRVNGCKVHSKAAMANDKQIATVFLRWPFFPHK